MFTHERITEQDERRKREIREWIERNLANDEETARLLRDELSNYIATNFFDPDKRLIIDV